MLSRPVPATAQLAAAVAAAAVAGCLTADAQVCATGRVCPSGTSCDDARDTCVAPGQVEACTPLGDGDDCTFATTTGTCQGGLCVPLACGDGVVRGDEDCDGSAAGTSCRSLGFYDEGSPACSPSCRFDVSTCTGFCRDGVRNGPEVCDGAPPDGDCTVFGFDYGALPCGSLCAPSFDGCGYIGLIGQPLSTQSGLDDLWGRSASDVYTVGFETILHFDGGSWSEVAAAYQPMYGVAGNQLDTYAVGRVGLVFHATAADPTSWEMEPRVTTDTLLAVSVAPDGTAVAVGTAGRIIRYDGNQWSLDTSTTSLILTGVWSDGVHAVAVGDGVYLEDSGAGWAAAPFPDTTGLRKVTGPAWGQLVVLAGTDLYLQDGGGGWTALPIPGPDPYDVAVDDLGVVVVTGGGGWVARYDGTRWLTLRPPRTDVAELMVWWGDGGGVVIGEEPLSPTAVVWTVSDALDVVETEPSAVPRLAVWGASPDDVWAVGDDDQVWRRDLVGWSQLPGPPAGKITCVWGDGSGAVLVGTDTGVVARWTGTGWSSQALTAGAMTALWGADGVVFAASSNEMYRDSGQGWEAFPPGGATSISGVAPDDLWAASGFGLRHYDGQGWTWDEISDLISFTSVWMASSQAAFAVSKGGIIYGWDGQAWSPMVSQTSRDLYAVWGFAADDVFAAGDDVLLHFDGTRWSRVRMARSLHARALWGSGSSLWVAGVEGLYRLERLRPWSCAASETRCDDGIDDDCDGLADLQDRDCSGP